jgi:hypothetical protein
MKNKKVSLEYHNAALKAIAWGYAAAGLGIGIAVGASIAGLVL